MALMSTAQILRNFMIDKGSCPHATITQLYPPIRDIFFRSEYIKANVDDVSSAFSNVDSTHKRLAQTADKETVGQFTQRIAALKTKWQKSQVEQIKLAEEKDKLKVVEEAHLKILELHESGIDKSKDIDDHRTTIRDNLNDYETRVKQWHKNDISLREEMEILFKDIVKLLPPTDAAKILSETPPFTPAKPG